MSFLLSSSALSEGVGWKHTHHAGCCHKDQPTTNVVLHGSYTVIKQVVVSKS